MGMKRYPIAINVANQTPAQCTQAITLWNVRLKLLLLSGESFAQERSSKKISKGPSSIATISANRKEASVAINRKTLGSIIGVRVLTKSSIKPEPLRESLP